MLLVCALLGCLSLQGAERPNVVLVVTDDQGYGDFSHAGHGALETPNLDRLEAESPKVERFYVSPVCSPTRASLMTGRWNYRTGVVDTWIGRSMMHPDEVTLAEVLRDAGWATGIFGKWHLGDCHPMRPIDQGFEEALVHRGGGLAQPSEPPANARRYTDAILFHGGEQVETEGYCTDVYFDAALDFVDRSLEAERPFFAYVATNAPHDPYHDVPEELYAKYAARDLAPSLEGKSDEVDREARICAMIENVDQNVGRLLARLEERGIERDTIVVFLNDNGPVWGRTTRGLHGHKSSVYEGGIRSPLFVRWPGRLDPEMRVEPIAAHVDVLPTLLSLVGLPLPESLAVDGRSLAPLLRGQEIAWPERHLFLQSHRGNVPAREHHFAVVGERWKLVRASGFGRQEPKEDHPFELFDLRADPGEKADVAAEYPEMLAALRDAYAAWFDDVTTTRADWSPPRIVLDAEAEPVTTLTRQDLRFPKGEGWVDEGGAWWLSSPAETERRVTLHFARQRTIDRARLVVGNRAFDFDVDATGTNLSVGTIRCPTGPFELSVQLWENDELVTFHQIELAVL